MVKFVERSCPLCGTSELGKEIVGLSFDEKVIGRETFSSRKNPDKLHHRMVVCPSCDLAYANPVLDSQWIREQYVGASFLTPIESSYAARNHERILLRVLSLLPDREEARRRRHGVRLSGHRQGPWRSHRHQGLSPIDQRQ